MENDFFFIKKMPLKEGLIEIDIEKIEKDIPKGYSTEKKPQYTITEKYIIVAIKCYKIKSEKRRIGNIESFIKK